MSTSSLSRAPLSGEQFEIVVIGGGVNGVAVARECALAGRSVLLLERNDFASGTTSRSTRIIHGGLRYLQYAEIGLVREALVERDRLVRERPHLVRPLRFVLAVDGSEHQNALKIRMGLWLYGRLAGRHWHTENRGLALRDLECQLDAGYNWSLFEYDDAQCEFPERLVVEWLSEAASAGAVIRNYAQVLDILQTDGRARGVLFRDRLTGDECKVECKWVINATGPWVDQLCSDASVPTGKPLVGGVRGSHLVLPRFAGAPTTAVYTQATDGRAIFVIPWNRQVMVGTTEVPDTGDPSGAQPSAQELEYLLNSANRLFPKANLTADDIHFAFAGIRPLPYIKGAVPSAVTRKSILYDHKQDGVAGMISIVGGKLTTAASLARKCAQAIGIRGGVPPKETLPAGSTRDLEANLRYWTQNLARDSGLPQETVHEIASLHGPRSAEIVRLATDDENMAQPLCPHTKNIVAEAVHALRNEFAVTLADVLLRRVPVALNACWSAECSNTAGRAIGKALGWTENENERQVETLEGERLAFLRKPEKGSLEGTQSRCNSEATAGLSTPPEVPPLRPR